MSESYDDVQAIADLGSQLEMSQEVIDRAEEIYDEQTEEDVTGQSLNTIAASSVLAASWDMKEPHTYREVRRTAGKPEGMIRFSWT